MTVPLVRIVHSTADAYASKLWTFATTVATPSRAPSMAKRAPLTLVSARSSEARFLVVASRIAVTASPSDRTAPRASSPSS